MGSSLFAIAKDQGIPDYIITEMIRIYSYDVDFQTQVKASDEFEVFYGEPDPQSASNEKVLLYAALKINGKMQRYYRYTVLGENQSNYFDDDGKSAAKDLLRAIASSGEIASGSSQTGNPQITRSEGGRRLSGKALSAFRQHQQKIIAMMKNAPFATQVAQDQ